jgi:hypothetical protein
MILQDLWCSRHEVALTFMPEDGEYRCPQDDACERLTLADILVRLSGNVGYVRYK